MMTIKKITSLLVLIILILSLLLAACDGGTGSGGISGGSVADPFGDANDTAADATATYGAEQLHIQLTAIAEQNH